MSTDGNASVTSGNNIDDETEQEDNNFGVIFHRQDLTNPRQIRSIGFNRINTGNTSMSRTNEQLLATVRRDSTLNDVTAIDNYRNLFSNYLLNTFLVDALERRVYPPSTEESAFWDPVKVGLTLLQGEKIQRITMEKEPCWICTEDATEWRKLPCDDKHKICNSCFLTWFSENVKCPYCKLDLRTKITAE